jgi:hypothetical protein
MFRRFGGSIESDSDDGSSLFPNSEMRQAFLELRSFQTHVTSRFDPWWNFTSEFLFLPMSPHKETSKVGASLMAQELLRDVMA